MKADYSALFEKVESSVAYWTTVPLIEFSRSLSRLMMERAVKRAELARRLGCSPAYVTKILTGAENLSAAKMAELAMAVGGVVHVHVADKAAVTHWRDEIQGGVAGALSADSAGRVISPQAISTQTVDVDPARAAAY